MEVVTPPEKNKGVLLVKYLLTCDRFVKVKKSKLISKLFFFNVITLNN